VVAAPAASQLLWPVWVASAHSAPPAAVGKPAGAASQSPVAAKPDSMAATPSSSTPGSFSSSTFSSCSASGSRSALWLANGPGLLSGYIWRGKHTEVQINHGLPGSLAVVDGTTEAENLTGKHPPDGTNGVATLVVGGDGNIDVLGGRVGVTEGNDGDVDVAGLLDSLGIGAGVRDDNQAGLLEGTGDVVGERTGGETTGNGLGTGVSGELQDSALTVGTSGDNADVGRVVDRGDDAGSESNLLPW
jgi:hypothetical protein